MATKQTTGCLLLALLNATGCLAPSGYIVTHTTVPYELPAASVSRRASKSCFVDITQLKEPFSGASLSVIWTSRAVLDAAARANMTELRYADLQTLSIMNGTYKRQRLVIYGE